MQHWQNDGGHAGNLVAMVAATITHDAVESVASATKVSTAAATISTVSFAATIVIAATIAVFF